MLQAVLCQRDPYLISGQRLAVELHMGDSTTDPLGVLDRNFVARGGVLKHDFEARPVLGNAGGENKNAPWRRRPRIDSMPALYIHPADPVYQGHTPPPTGG